MLILEGYHISFLLLVTTSRKPSVTTSNYRDTNPGLYQPLYDTTRPTRQPKYSSFTFYCLQPPTTNHVIATFCSCTASLRPCSSHLPYAYFTQGSYTRKALRVPCHHGVRHTWATLALHVDASPHSYHHRAIIHPHVQTIHSVGTLFSTRLPGTLGSTAHLRRVYAMLIMRAQEHLNLVFSNTICNIPITATAAGT